MLFLNFCRRSYRGSYDKHLEHVGNRAHGDYKGAGGRLLQEYMGEAILFLFCSGVGWQLYPFLQSLYGFIYQYMENTYSPVLSNPWVRGSELSRKRMDGTRQNGPSMSSARASLSLRWAVREFGSAMAKPAAARHWRTKLPGVACADSERERPRP